jgi:hypothetical protein
MKHITRLLIPIFLCICTSCNDHVDKQIFKEEISGLVVKKYKNMMDHGATCIDLNNGSTLDLILWHSDTTDLWGYIAVGDSVYKPSGVYSLKVIKPSGETKEFPYDFD